MAQVPQVSAATAAAPEARPAGVGRAIPRPLVTPATATMALLVLALIVAAVHFVWLVSDYGRLFVHPDYYQRILREALRDGLAIGPSDVLNSMQQREVGESRARFLAYLIQTVDQKLRLWLYTWMPVHPTLAPLAWLLQLVVAPYFLYRLLRDVTEDEAAALAGLAVYLSSIGFLSGFSMGFLQGKTLSNAVLIVAMYLTSVAARSLAPGQLLVQAKGASKYLLLVVLLLGLFVDELPVAAFFVVPLFFWPVFLPPWPWTTSRIGAVVRNGLFFAIPVAAFLAFVVFVVPTITERYFGYTFDFLGNTLAIHPNSMGTVSVTQGRLTTFTPAVVLENVTTLFGLSLVPWFVSPITPSAYADIPGGQVNNLPKILALVGFFTVAGLVAARATSRVARSLRGYLVALVLFFVFLSLLQIRHIPIVTGYYYGAQFGTLFSILVALLVKGVGDLYSLAKPLAALAVLLIVGVQLANFAQVNVGWIALHNEQMTRKAVQGRLQLTGPRDLSPDEVRELWSAWQRGQLDNYIKRYGVPPAAAYVVYELKEIDNNRPGRTPTRR